MGTGSFPIRSRWERSTFGGTRTREGGEGRGRAPVGTLELLILLQGTQGCVCVCVCVCMTRVVKTLSMFGQFSPQLAKFQRLSTDDEDDDDDRAVVVMQYGTIACAASGPWRCRPDRWPKEVEVLAIPTQSTAAKYASNAHGGGHVTNSFFAPYEWVEMIDSLGIVG
ncbi:uncharacterized protein LY79DRAFT_165847 [Colletotrichum navitas]|uniref:Uncharacterized protein n=1 Tax=Colletotrichum navitas TaxID=681940 RepID=A0AAD8Q191_9PEZI|nr:uncharacterized protein LY79DRAFT_165847 [Colletotrichum navitas]KAK1593985.1 hypothetical protein LY79DRAFT_165847 [Colletotrichum navitas]